MNLTFYRYGALLNLLDLRSIMGCPGPSTHSVFMCAFQQKERTSMYISWQKGDHLHPNKAQHFFFHYNLFLRKLKEKLAPKARKNTDASISDCAHAPLGIP